MIVDLYLFFFQRGPFISKVGKKKLVLVLCFLVDAYPKPVNGIPHVLKKKDKHKLSLEMILPRHVCIVHLASKVTLC